MTHPPDRPDQRLAAQTRSPGPPPSTNVFAFVVIIGPKGNLLVYSPTAGAGNLIASVAASNGVDAYGNEILSGITAYSFPGSSATRLVNNGVQNLELIAGVWTNRSTLSMAASTGSISLGSAVAGSKIQLGTLAQCLVGGTASTSALLDVEGTTATSGVIPIISAAAETVHQITAGFPAGWSGTISYWQTADGVSTRATIDYHLTIANTTVVTNNEALGVSLASGYFYPTDNKFVFGQINGGGLAGNNFAPMRISSTGALFYGGPGFTASSSAFWYGGHTYAIAV